jgi:hypothetical protein
MFTHRKFDVEIRRAVQSGTLRWPDRGEAAADSGLGCNRAYRDLRRRTWGEAKLALDLERDLITSVESRFESFEDESVADELLESMFYLDGLDVGVASTVISLAAAKCIPFSSCNARAFGGDHQEQYPLVAFYSRPAAVDLLLASAEESGIGLEGGHHLIAWADNIRNFMRFAQSLINRRAAFASLRLKVPRQPRKSREGRSDPGLAFE